MSRCAIIQLRQHQIFHSAQRHQNPFNSNNAICISCFIFVIVCLFSQTFLAQNILKFYSFDLTSRPVHMLYTTHFWHLESDTRESLEERILESTIEGTPETLQADNFEQMQMY